jgi:succinylglutamic semialdehyde dehydrogenase
MAVLGPFNFPAHLPNGHIVPALAMGNTVVFKPSDKAPCTAQLLVEFLEQALAEEDLPDDGAGIINLVHGGAEAAVGLVTNRGVDGILFTGSWPVGRRILEANLDHPGKIVALELGGNNPVVVMPDADMRQAAIEIVRCAFNTTGQRCTCTRRVLVHEDAAKRVVPAIREAASRLVIGDPRSETPVFMGPIINRAARDAVLSAQTVFEREGGRVLLRGREVESDEGGWYVSPSIIEVDEFTKNQFGAAGCDTEIFGPLLRIATVRSLDEAIAQSNATAYGLAASIFTSDERAIEFFLAEAHAGCVNVNTGTAGASSRLPVGGVGRSGNHRPAGAFSLDYCAYPVAGMIERGSAATLAEGMTFDNSWLG